MIGEEGILEELELAGYTGIGGPVRFLSYSFYLWIFFNFRNAKLQDDFYFLVTFFLCLLILQEDGKKAVELKANQLFEHDKTVRYYYIIAKNSILCLMRFLSDDNVFRLVLLL